MNPKKKLQLRAILKELKDSRARHTELISVYVPAGYDLTSVISQLSQEQGTAENIKSKATKKNVQGALEKMIRQLRVIGRTPQHGLAIFSGNISESEGGQNFIVRSIEPPEALNVKIYRCDQTFFLEPLKKFLDPKKVYGLIVIDRQGADFGLLKGSRIEHIFEKDSLVPGKTRKGGQSAQRFERVREGIAKDFFKGIAQKAREIFSEVKKLHGIILGGPGPTKEDFVTNYLDSETKKKIIAVKNIGYTGNQGMEELVEKSKDVLAQEEIAREKSAVNNFFSVLNKNPSHAAYGLSEIEKAISMSAIKKLLLSEKLDEFLAEKLANKVETTGGEWMLVSQESREGEQLYALGGIAAVLRFPIM